MLIEIKPTIHNIETGDKCYCMMCDINRSVKKVIYIQPKLAEVQTAEYKIYLSCGHKLSIKISNTFEE